MQLRILNFQLAISNWQLQITNCKLQMANCQFEIAHFLLQISYLLSQQPNLNRELAVRFTPVELDEMHFFVDCHGDPTTMGHYQILNVAHDLCHCQLQIANCKLSIANLKFLISTGKK